jgi:hypothetical protein
MLSSALAVASAQKSGPTPTTPISDAQLNKVILEMKERGERGAVPPGFTDHLGLTKNGGTLTLLSLAFKENSGPLHHVLFLLDGGAGYIFTQRNADGITYCYVDANLRLIAAVYQPRGHLDLYVNTPLTEAQKTLNEELLSWADIADSLFSK